MPTGEGPSIKVTAGLDTVMLSSNPTTCMAPHATTHQYMFSINYNWVSGDRVQKKSATQHQQHTITYKQLHKTASWNKQGWANEKIIVYQAVHSFRVCGQLYP